MDARELPEDPQELAEVVETHSVFGRVTPHQKRAMVGALQLKGHVVAMTGDGVNDALALKDADIGVAMGSGAAATRAVAQLVLLDGKFAVLPGVVAEGRRVIANIERSANLFVTKTVYATFLAIAVVIAGWKYPFLPRHLTIISTFTIGIPGFFLAIAPNKRRYIPGFVERVLALHGAGGDRRVRGHDGELRRGALRARPRAHRSSDHRDARLGRGRPVGARDPGATVQLVEDGAGRVDGRRHGADARDPRLCATSTRCNSRRMRCSWRQP